LEGGAMSISTNLARHTVRQLIELGIEDVVLSPGSRSAPLSIAFYQAQKKGLIRLHVRIDERGAAFFALGISKASGKYVPALCTSGTAVANYYPALLEAYHSNINLLLLTADRPARLRKTGSNQTTLQSNFFGEFVTHHVDSPSPLDLSHLLGDSGPVHINLQFDEPLLPEEDHDWLDGIRVQPIAQGTVVPGEISLHSKRNILIVGHDRAGFTVDEIETFAERLALPIIAEDPLSFPSAIAHSAFFLADEQVRRDLQPELAIVIGRTTLSRSINSYIDQAEKRMVIDPRMKRVDSQRTAEERHQRIPRVSKSIERDPLWHALWQKYSELAAQVIQEMPSWSEASAAITIAKDLENDCALFISSSRPIRDLESFASPRSGLTTYANRGLAGIDGNISTAMGIATKHDETFAVIGDLAFLHDVSALANPIDEALTLIVIDNNGGGIFSTLPQRGVDGFEEIFGTPHNLKLEDIAKSFGASVEVVSSSKELHIALQRVHPRLHFIIAQVPSREANAEALFEALTRLKNLMPR
jgi:2-succinyl-5-enolpyruvyl-6-hydroxy-3-cyclohexene-1-carboxylate synthase